MRRYEVSGGPMDWKPMPHGVRIVANGNHRGCSFPIMERPVNELPSKIRRPGAKRKHRCFS